MSDEQLPSEGMEVSTNPDAKGNANLIYILYLVGLATFITALVGVIMAYTAKDNGPDWLKTHYIHQIHIFWKFLAWMLVGTLLLIVLVGVFVILCGVIWYIIQIIRGMQTLSRGEPMAKPAGWFL